MSKVPRAALARSRSLWQSSSRGNRALALALCLAPILLLAIAFSRGASGAQPGDGDPFRASARMQRLLAPKESSPAVDLPTAVALEPEPAAPAPLHLVLRGRLQMEAGPLVVLLEVEGQRGLQRLAVGETLVLNDNGAERRLQLVEDRGLWVVIDGGAPVPLR
ncbi:MAG: hypothetical protein GC161_04595 [Planctomycetaceae bacterium]|nr:hypothetical protein [Planctomycetaceae bacterium]